MDARAPLRIPSGTCSDSTEFGRCLLTDRFRFPFRFPLRIPFRILFPLVLDDFLFVKSFVISDTSQSMEGRP